VLHIPASALLDLFFNIITRLRHDGDFLLFVQKRLSRVGSVPCIFPTPWLHSSGKQRSHGRLSHFSKVASITLGDAGTLNHNKIKTDADLQVLIFQPTFTEI